MPKWHHSHDPWRRIGSRSARLGTLLRSIALGFSIAIVALLVLNRVQKHAVAPVRFETTTVTAPTLEPKSVEPASELSGKSPLSRSSPAPSPSLSMGKATDVSGLDLVRSTWSLQLIGDRSETRALEKYKDLQNRFPAILSFRTPIVVRRELGGRGSAFWYQIRLTENSRERAVALCLQLRSVGAECLLQRPLDLEATPKFEPNNDVGDLTALKKRLGVGVTDLSTDLRKRYKIANSIAGVVVAEVDRSLPTIAERLFPGDVIVEVAQEPVVSSDDFWNKIDRFKKARRETVLLSIVRVGGNLRFVPLPLTKP
jgi:hypothetical protein